MSWLWATSHRSPMSLLKPLLNYLFVDVIFNSISLNFKVSLCDLIFPPSLYNLILLSLILALDQWLSYVLYSLIMRTYPVIENDNSFSQIRTCFIPKVGKKDHRTYIFHHLIRIKFLMVFWFRELLCIHQLCLWYDKKGYSYSWKQTGPR